MRRNFGSAAVVITIGVTLAGCSSSSSSSTTTTKANSPTTSSSAPATATGGAATPEAVAAALIADIPSGSYTAFCEGFAVPDQVANCKSDLTGVNVKFNNFVVGKVQVQGSQALINFTGTVCQGAQCQSNTDPNSATSDGTSFSDAFAAANDPNSQNGSSFVSAAVEQNGRWYASGF